MSILDKPHFQIINPYSFLFAYKEHFVHVTGRDGLQHHRGVRTATKTIEKLEDITEEIFIDDERKVEAKVFLTGLWYDVRANVNVYFVTQPSVQYPFFDDDRVPDNVYGSLFRQTKKALQVVQENEDGQALQGNLAEYFYTGGMDYAHPIHKFYGISGLFRGLACVEDTRLKDFDNQFGSVGIDTLWSHPKEVLENENSVNVYTYEEFNAKMENPPRGKYGPGDALRWGLIKPEDLRHHMDPEEGYDGFFMGNEEDLFDPDE